MNTVRTDRKNQLYIALFVLVFFISNFNALLQVFISRMVLTGVYVSFLGIAIVKNLHKNRFRVSIANGALAVFLYILWIVVRFAFQLIGGVRTSQSFISFAQTLIPIFAFYLAIEMNDGDTRKCERAYVWFAIVSVLLGFINRAVRIIPESYFANELVRVEGLIYNRFYSMSGFSLGTGWMCGIAIAFLLGSGDTIIKRPFIRIEAYIALVAAVLLTFSRGGIFFTLIIVVLHLTANLFINRKHMGKEKTIGWLFFIILAIVLMMVLWERIVSSAFFSRYIVNAFDSKTSMRAGFHEQALQYIAQRPVFGKGFGFVGTTAYATGIGAGFPPENNYYLIAINTGLVGLVLFVLSSVLPVVKNITFGGHSTDGRVIVYIGIVTGALAWSLMSTPLEGDINTMVFWYSMGRIANTATPSQRTQNILR